MDEGRERKYRIINKECRILKGRISTVGQHEVLLELRSPVSPGRDAIWQDEVNKNSTEPKVEMRR